MWANQSVLLLSLFCFGIVSPVDWVGVLKKSQISYKSSLVQQIFQDTPLDYINRNSIIELRLRSVEERLRTLEQPLWTIEVAGESAWDRCTTCGTVCHCNPLTKILSCWRNKLKFLPTNQHLPNDVFAIDLSQNYLTTFHRDSFRGLSHLKELDLSSNELDYIPGELLIDLENLVTLRLQNNRIHDIDDSNLLAKLLRMENLDISHNKLETLSHDLFTGNPMTTLLKMSSNNLTFVPLSLATLGFLEELDLQDNQLTELTKHSFPGLYKLKTLQLSNNQLENISDLAFVDLIQLELLRIDNNRIEVVNRMCVNLTNLIILDLTNNNIRKISLGAFDNLIRLEELLLGQNGIIFLQTGLFNHLSQLQKLTLFFNEITVLESGAFNGLINLQVLLVNNNLLRDFHEDIFRPMNQLKQIRLDSNKLRFLPNGCLDNATKLATIKLDKNPWHCGDCRALYLARWLRAAGSQIIEGTLPTCRGPGSLGGYPVGLLRFDHLCDGEFLAMVKLAPRIPLRDSMFLKDAAKMTVIQD